MSKLVQFTDALFPDLNQNPYDVSVNLNVSIRSVNLSANNQGLFSFSLQIASFLQVPCSVFYKVHSPGRLQKWNLLHVS